MSDNPYSAPSADVEVHGSPQELELHDPRSVDAGRGLSWIGEGFGHFKQTPGTWIGICIIGFIVMVIMSLIPFVNILNNLLTYVWVGGLMLGCKAQDDGDDITVGHLFAGFQQKFGPLLLLGVLVTVAGIVVMVVTLGPIYAQLISAGLSGDTSEIEAVSGGFPEGLLLRMLVAMLFMIPLMMFFWFAPLLVVLNNVPVFEALRLSFFGCLKNIVPFLIYGVVMLVLFAVATLPLALGLLVLMPTAFGSMYRSYKDIYIAT